VTPKRGESEGGGDLPDCEVDEQNTRGGRGSKAGDDRAGALLQSRVLEQSNNGQNKPDDGHISTRNECFPERGHDSEWVETARDSCRQPGDSDDQKWIDPEDESDDDDDDADESEHEIPLSL
jgi:hypothetical protein